MHLLFKIQMEETFRARCTQTFTAKYFLIFRRWLYISVDHENKFFHMLTLRLKFVKFVHVITLRLKLVCPSGHLIFWRYLQVKASHVPLIRNTRPGFKIFWKYFYQMRPHQHCKNPDIGGPNRPDRNGRMILFRNL